MLPRSRSCVRRRTLWESMSHCALSCLALWTSDVRAGRSSTPFVRPTFSSAALMETSQLEQDIATTESAGDHRDAVLELLGNAKVGHWDALRLVMVYALRHEKTHAGNVRAALLVACVVNVAIYRLNNAKQRCGGGEWMSRTSSCLMNC